MPPPAETDPPPKKLTLKNAEFESVNQPSGTPEPAGGDPMDILRINCEHEQKIGYAELPPLPPRHRISRRNREYLAFLAGGNLLLVGTLILTGNFLLLAAMGLYTASLTWVMLFVFDDY